MKIRNKIKSPTSFIALLTLVLISASIVGVAIATKKVEGSITNEILTPTVDVGIKEEFDPNSKIEWGKEVSKKVQFYNMGSTLVFLRMSYVEFWFSEDAGMLSNYIDGNEIATKVWTNNFSSEWVDGLDGWYYYKKVLEPGKTTHPILNSVSFGDYPNDERYLNADYRLDFRIEVVQASKDNEVNKEATTKVFKKHGVVNGSVVTWQ